jgi:hypothetical protein
MSKVKPELEFELSDIFDDIKFSKEGIAQNDEKLIEQNIIYILKREKLWKKGFSICFPCGSNQMLDINDNEDNPSSYQYDFEIFSDLNTVIASGTAFGSIMTSENPKTQEFQSAEIIDMTCQICECEKRFLEKNGDKELVVFT